LKGIDKMIKREKKNLELKIKTYSRLNELISFFDNLDKVCREREIKELNFIYYCHTGKFLDL